MSGYFITSTDTNVGKTTVSLCLMKYFKTVGKTIACMKPVSAGCEATADGLRNDDAVLLMKESSVELPYDQVNPYAFEAAIAPHIAAQQSDTVINLQTIKNYYTAIAAKADVVIVEGAGGWLVPVNDSQTMADVAAALELPVILVVGMRLGCLNHALLTASSIIKSGLPFAGWLANHVDKNMLQQIENINALKERIQAPFLGSMAYNTDINSCSIVFSEANVPDF